MIIRDKDKVITKIENFLKKNKDSMTYIKIDSIEVENKRTGRTDVVKDIYVCATGKGSARPKIICGFVDSRNTYILHDDIAHVNVGSWSVTRVPTSKTNKLITREFCNPVKEIHLWEDPKKAKMILKGNLMETNPGSPMRSDAIPVRLDSTARFRRDANTNEFMRNDATFEQMLVSTYDLSDLTENTISIIAEKRNQLLENKNLVYAYVARKNEISPPFHWDFIEKEDLENYITQDYYKTYSYEDIDKTFVIPKTQYDVLCVGVGSAGSNMLEQLCKLNYFEKYRLIDYDRIENKNLRNQTYRMRDIGTQKVSAMRSYILDFSPLDDISVKTNAQKYEDVIYSLFKTKYTISGFDSISCRQGLLDKIKSGELETEYLIDARYDHLNSSLFFVDVNNKNEMEYYEKLLQETDKELKEREKTNPRKYEWSLDDVKRHLHAAYDYTRCSEMAYILGLSNSQVTKNICGIMDGTFYSCGSKMCLECLKRAAEKMHIPVPEDGCTEHNIIHIYKLTSTWVTSAIRSIEVDKVKPFTHVELTVEPVPNGMIIKK